MVRRETSAEVDSAAAEWAARFDRGHLTEREENALEAWLRADPRRNGAYARHLAILDHLDRARALGPGYDPEQFQDPPPAWLDRRTLLRSGGGALAAGVTALAVGIGIAGRAAHYTSRRGEVRLVSLSDGSVLTLNSASKVAINYTDSARNVALLGGEALFDVAKNPHRPFIVDAGDADSGRGHELHGAQAR